MSSVASCGAALSYGQAWSGALYTWNVVAGTASEWSDWTMDRYFKTAP
jgi:hypothetical protein